ncbi:putative transposase [Shigella flexneri K-315]|nr:putative transposase [Shigella flexneri K-315]
MPCFTAMRAEIALMSGSAFAVTHHAFSSGAGRTSDGNGSHASTLKSPSYTKSVSWQHYPHSRTGKIMRDWHRQRKTDPLSVACRPFFGRSGRAANGLSGGKTVASIIR